MRVFTRKRLIGLTIALVLGCAAFVYGLRCLEAAMTFRPSRMAAAEKIASGGEDVWFNSADGTHLNGRQYLDRIEQFMRESIKARQ